MERQPSFRWRRMSSVDSVTGKNARERSIGKPHQEKLVTGQKDLWGKKEIAQVD